MTTTDRESPLLSSARTWALTSALGLALAAAGCAPADDEPATPDVATSELAATADACAGAQGIGHVGWAEARGVAEVDQHRPPRLHLALGVDDAAAHARVPGYDGARERAFACVPVRPGPYGTGPRFRRVDLAWRGAVPRGGRTVDVHRASVDVDPDFDTPSWSWTRGVYFGLETPAGIVWAQWPGDDVTVRPLGVEPPTEHPLP